MIPTWVDQPYMRIPANNYNPAYLSNWQPARRNAIDGISRSKVACIGDSTTMGHGAGSPSATDNARDFSFPAQLALALSAAGTPARRRNLVGTNLANSGTATTVTAYYGPGIIAQTNWATTSAITLGNDWWNSVTLTTNPFVFSPGEVWDTCDVYAANGGTVAGTLQLVGTGGTPVIWDQGAVPGYAKRTVSCASASAANTLTANSTLGTVCSMSLIDPYNTLSPDVSILNMGWSGSTTGDWASNTAQPWHPRNSLPVVAPVLTIIDLGINNWTDTPPVSVAAFKAEYQTLITAAKLTGDVLLVIPFPSSTTRASIAQQQGFVTAIYELAVSNNCVVADMWRLFTSYDVANASGFYYDDRHPNAAGYLAAAQYIARILLANG